MQIYSFDVFDTIITRLLASPDDVFSLIQTKIDKDSFPLPAVLINCFPKIRLDAEKFLRCSAQKEEIQFDEIYKHIQDKFQLDDNLTAYLKTLELKTEFELIVPIQWTLNEIYKLQKKGERVIFISDMYLPRQAIKLFFDKIYLSFDEGAFYLSSEIGLTKYSGNLFKYIIEKENCSPKEMIHFGDNPYSDIFIPHQLGISIYQTPPNGIKQIEGNIRFHIRKLKNDLIKKHIMSYGKS